MLLACFLGLDKINKPVGMFYVAKYYELSSRRTRINSLLKLSK